MSMHALRPPRRPAGADQHREVVRRARRPARPAIAPVGASPQRRGARSCPASRQTRVVSAAAGRGSWRPAGRRPPGRAAPCSRRASSSSRFSSASLRGLTGHHTAPARAMPKTHANAIGSLADRIADLVARPDAGARERAGDPAGEVLHLGVGSDRAVHRQAGRVAARATRPCRGSRRAQDRSVAGGHHRVEDQAEAAQHAEQLAVPERLAAGGEARPAAAAAAAASTPPRPASARSACSCCCRG